MLALAVLHSAALILRSFGPDFTAYYVIILVLSFLVSFPSSPGLDRIRALSGLYIHSRVLLEE